LRNESREHLEAKVKANNTKIIEEKCSWGGNKKRASAKIFIFTCEQASVNNVSKQQQQLQQHQSPLKKDDLNGEN
jgi:hypothetical protein